MRPNNYATFFVSGSDQEAFSYASGAEAHYVMIASRSYVMLTVVVFADSPAHAEQIVGDAVAFGFACAEKYAATERGREDRHGLLDGRIRKLTQLREALDRKSDAAVHVGLLDRTQLTKVGWAGNDTMT